MLAGKSVRLLDAAIITVVAALLTLGGFFAWQVYTHRQGVEESTPVSRAIEQLRAAVRQKPNDLDLRMQLAQAYTVAGRDNEAAEQYEAVLKVNKENASAISGLGFLAAPEPIAKAIDAIQSHSTSNPTSFAQKGGVAALTGPQDHLPVWLAEFDKRSGSHKACINPECDYLHTHGEVEEYGQED